MLQFHHLELLRLLILILFFFVPAFNVFLSLLSSPLSLFVALCSANFLLSKSFVARGDLDANDGFTEALLLNVELVFGLKPPDLDLEASSQKLTQHLIEVLQ